MSQHQIKREIPFADVGPDHIESIPDQSLIAIRLDRIDC